jgi:hypothetical protein
MKKEGRGDSHLQMYMVMGCHPGDVKWRTAFCSTSKWKECGVRCNEKNGEHE